MKEEPSAGFAAREPSASRLCTKLDYPTVSVVRTSRPVPKNSVPAHLGTGILASSFIPLPAQGG